MIAKEKNTYMVEQRSNDYKFSSEIMREKRQWKRNLNKEHKTTTTLEFPLSVVVNLTSIHEDWVLILALLSGLRIWHCRELWGRSQMWLGSGIAVAVTVAGSCSSDLTPSLELSYATRVALKSKKKKKPKCLCYYLPFFFSFFFLFFFFFLLISSAIGIQN